MPIYEVEIRRYKTNREESIIRVVANSPEKARETVAFQCGEATLYILTTLRGITQGDFSVGKWTPIRVREQGGHWQ